MSQQNLYLITDRVRSTREGYDLTRLCPSIHPSICLSTPRGGGVPQPGPDGEGVVPWPGPGGGYPTLSNSHCTGWGVPLPGGNLPGQGLPLLGGTPPWVPPQSNLPGGTPPWVPPSDLVRNPTSGNPPPWDLRGYPCWGGYPTSVTRWST